MDRKVYVVLSSGGRGSSSIIELLARLIAAIVDKFYGMTAVRRRRVMMGEARRLGLEYLPGDPYNLPRLHGHMPAFSGGHWGRAYNMLRGKCGARPLLVTDYKFKVGTKRVERTAYRTYCLVYSEKIFGELYVRPEGVIDKVTAIAGFDDIDFESKQFSDMFHVRCNNKKFAYDVINPPMMEYLMQAPGLHLEFSGDVMIAHYNKRLKPAQIEPLIEVVRGIARNIPTYL